MYTWTSLTQLGIEFLKLHLLVHIVICDGRRYVLEPSPSPRNAAAIEAAFREHNIIPDLISKAPKHTLQVAFHREYHVDFGNYIVPAAWEQRPTKVYFANAEKNRMYVLVMTGPDFPSRGRPKGREWWYWVMGDLLGGPGPSKKGRNVMVYIGPDEMRVYSGVHRIVFLLMEQLDGRVWYEVEDKHMMSTPTEKIRSRHNVTKFIQKYNLTGPIAGNFFTSGYNYPRRLTPAPQPQ